MKSLTFEQKCDQVALVLRQRFPGIPTEQNLIETIENVSLIQPMLGNEAFSEEEKQNIKATVEARLTIRMDLGVSLVDEATYVPWLAQRKADIDEYYWNRYKRFLLEEKGWSPSVVESLDHVGDSILNLLGDPAESKAWHRKGLVLGDIQSGKTSNYLALINKAADAGYKLIILLTGTLEALRKQTQERVDEGFIGRNSRNVLKRDMEQKYVGVGRLDKQRTAFPLTDVISDFDVKKLQAYGFNAQSISDPLVLVVKKNTTVLKNLLAWIETSYKDQADELIQTPMLLIDDESDNASVNTKKPECDPTAINAGIRNILHLFQHSTYVAVTATPFANIFINPDKEPDTTEDLFPSDFIYALSPPDNYIGSHSIFGDNAKYGNCLEVISDGEVFSSKDRAAHVVSFLPSSLKSAVRYFFLCNLIRDLKGKTNDHRSMLVNVNAFTNPQECVFDLLQDYVGRLQRDVKGYGKLPVSEALLIPSIGDLKSTWDEFNLSQLSEKTFEEILPVLVDSIMPICVTMVNTKTKARGLERLDYTLHTESGYRVIAVGGNSLSRGITLEGLCVSYFYRESKMYDTLLQMGRWFGYRPGYENLFKIWMSDRTMGWFSFIHKACDELRSEVSYMTKLGQTPSEFGLKVRAHPDTLMITASNKMRSSKPFEQLVSLSGKLVETPWLSRRNIDVNGKHTEKFLETIGEQYTLSSRGMYEGVDNELIAEFVSNFVSHPGHLVFDGRQIGKYIQDNAKILKPWCVRIAEGSDDEEITISPTHKIQRTVRKMLVDGDCIRIGGNKSRIGSVGTCKITLTEEQAESAKNDYVEYQKKRERDVEGKKLVVPDHMYLRYAESPLLVIYLMTCSSKQNEPTASEDALQSYRTLRGKTIVGLSLGFPGMGTAKEEKICYKINLVEQKKNLPFYDTDDIDGDEDDED